MGSAAYRPLIVASLVLCSMVRAQEPATAPATLEVQSPKQVLKTYNAAMRAGDRGTIERIFFATNDAQQRVARAMARAEVHVGRMLVAAHDRFGPEALARVQRAFRDNSDADIDAAELRISVDRAVLSFSDSNTTEFVLVDGSWKVPVASLLPDGADVELVIDSISRRGNFAKVLAQEIGSGQIKTVEQLIDRIQRRQRNRADGAEN